MAHAQCETCGNIYEKAFHVSLDGQTHVFDCFECAIEALAPRCTHCHLRVIGHGVESGGSDLLLPANWGGGGGGGADARAARHAGLGRVST